MCGPLFTVDVFNLCNLVILDLKQVLKATIIFFVNTEKMALGGVV